MATDPKPITGKRPLEEDTDEDSEEPKARFIPRDDDEADSMEDDLAVHYPVQESAGGDDDDGGGGGGGGIGGGSSAMEEGDESYQDWKESSLLGIDYNSSADEAEDGQDAPMPLERQRQAAVARMQRLFGLQSDEIPDKPLIQDDSNYLRKMYWTCIQDSGFPYRVNHAVCSRQ